MYKERLRKKKKKEIEINSKKKKEKETSRKRVKESKRKKRKRRKKKKKEEKEKVKEMMRGDGHCNNVIIIRLCFGKNKSIFFFQCFFDCNKHFFFTPFL